MGLGMRNVSMKAQTKGKTVCIKTYAVIARVKASTVNINFGNA